MAQRTCTIDNCTRRLSAVGMCATHYRNMRLYGRIEGAPDPVCQTCGSAFPRPGKGGPLPRYCSRGCDPARRPRLAACRACGAEFDRGDTSAIHCSNSCAQRYSRAGGFDPTRPCEKCGEPIDFTQKGPGGRRPRLNVRTCRKCKRNHHYKVSITDLVERDGSSCGICGEDVDLDVRWPQRMAATRDHIVPVALGGSDDPDNLQLAHATCNRRKGATLAA